MVETPGIVNQRLGGGSTRRRWYIVDGSVSIVKHPPSAIQLVVRWRFAGLAGIWQALNRTLNICTHNIHGERGYLYFMLVTDAARPLVGVCKFSNQHTLLCYCRFCLGRSSLRELYLFTCSIYANEISPVMYVYEYFIAPVSP